MSAAEETTISKNGCEVYIRGLAADVTEKDLSTAFGSYGTLEKIRVKTRPKSSFAFLLYSTADGANAAIDAMNGQAFKYALSATYLLHMLLPTISIQMCSSHDFGFVRFCAHMRACFSFVCNT